MMDNVEKFRGHPIRLIGDTACYVYVDTGEKVKDVWQSRECGYCNEPNRPDGHDACIGELSGVMNACCGHGLVNDAYIQYVDGSIVRGQQALDEMEDGE